MPEPVPQAVTGNDGHFVLQYQGVSGDALIEIREPGFTKALRTVTLKPNTSVTIPDARLTPVNTHTVSALSGAVVLLDENTLTFPAAAFDIDTELAVAQLYQQGLGLRLPPGWSPVYGIDIAAGDITLRKKGELKVKNIWSFSDKTEVVAAYLDETTASWHAVNFFIDAGFITIDIDRVGQYVLIAPDALPVAPPMPQTVGEAISPSVDTIPDGGAATVEVTPPAVLSAEGVRAVTGILVTTLNALPSGTVVEAGITEKFTLSTGEVINTEPLSQDITLYRWSYTGPYTDEANTLGASFPVSPSKYYPLGSLYYGRVGIDISWPVVSNSGSVVTGDIGGTVTGPDGASIIVPPLSLTGDAVFTVSIIPAAALPAAGNGVTYAGGLMLQMDGGLFRQDMFPQFVLPGFTAPDGTKIIVARVESINGVSSLRAVAKGSIINGKISVDGCLSVQGSTGNCINSGSYAFYVPTAPFGFVAGTVSKSNAPLVGAIISTDSLPFKTISDNSGRFLLPATSGNFAVTALDSSTGQSASATGTLGAGETKTVDIILANVDLTVAGVVPFDKATGVAVDSRITVTFSASVDPATVTADSFIVSEPIFPNTQSPIAGRISLSSQNKVAVFIPDAGLKADTFYHVKLTADIKDASGNSLVPFESVFTTSDVLGNDALPAGALRVSMPDADGNVIVKGGVGLTYGGAVVVIINNKKNIVLTVIADDDGSFSGKIRADITDELTVQVLDLLGNITVLSLGLFQNDDGSAAVGPKGGTVYGPGGIKAMVPEGAFDETVTLKVTMGIEDEVKDVPIDPAMRHVAVFHIDSGDAQSKKEIKVAFPAPEWITDEHQILIGEVTNVRGFEELMLTCPAVLKGESGQAARTIESTSPPFRGLYTQGGYGSWAVRTWTDPKAGAGYALLESWNPYDTVVIFGGFAFVEPVFSRQINKYPITVPVNTTFTVNMASTSGQVLESVTIQGPPARGMFTQDVVKITTDKEPPAVFTSSVPDGSQGVLLADNIIIEMSEPVNATTVNCDTVSCANTVVVKDSNGNIIDGTVYLAADDKTIVFVPTYGYKYATDYTITIDGVKDLGGNLITGYTSAFKTFEPTIFATVPGVSNTMAIDRYKSSVDGRDYLLATGSYTDSSGTLIEDSGLVVVDVSDPEHPVEKGVFHTMGFDRDVKALPNVTLTDHSGTPTTGDFAVVIGGSASTMGYLTLMDVTDPANPYPYEYLYLSWNTTYIDNWPAGVPVVPGTPYAVALLGNFAYVANLGLGVQAIDLSKVTPPQYAAQQEAIVSTYTDPFDDPPSFRGIDTLRGNKKDLVLVTSNHTLTVLDSQMSLQSKIATLNYPFSVTGVAAFLIDVDGDGNLGDFEDKDGDVYTAKDETFDLAFVSTNDGIAVIDVTDPLLPCMMDLIRTGGLPGKVSVDREKRLAYAVINGITTISLKDLRPSETCLVTPPPLSDNDKNGDGVDDRILTTVPTENGSDLVLNDDGTVAYLPSASGVRRIYLGGEKSCKCADCQCKKDSEIGY